MRRCQTCSFVLFLVSLIAAVSVSATGALEGQVVDPAGNPVQGLEVTTVDIDDCQRCFSTETDREGNFVFPALPDGIYCVSVREDGACVASELDIAVTQDATTEVAFRLPGGEIRGRVMSATGAGVSGAEVSALALNGSSGRTETEPDGSYLLRLLPPGEYFVSVRSDDHPGMKIEPVLIAEPTSVVSGVDVVLPPGGRVRGRIRGPDGEPIADAEIKLSGDSDSGEREWVRAESSKDGSYILPAVRTGTYEITFRAKSLAFQRVEEIRVEEGRETVVDTILSDPAAIEGIVRSAVTGFPVVGATMEVSFTDDDDWFLGALDEAITSATGYYRLSGELPGGIFEVSGEPPTGELIAAKVEPVITREGETTRGIDIELPPSSSISGTVRDTTGNPVEGLKLVALEEDERPGWGPLGCFAFYSPSAVTDASGRFRIEGIAPGPKCLAAPPKDEPDVRTPPGYSGLAPHPSRPLNMSYATFSALLRAEPRHRLYPSLPPDQSGPWIYHRPWIIEVGPNEAVDGVEVTLAEEMGSISGTVRSASTGEPLAGAKMYALDQDESTGGSTSMGRASATTDENGFYVLSPLRPHNYSVKVEYVPYEPPESCTGSCPWYAYIRESTEPVHVFLERTTAGVDFSLAKTGGICGKVLEGATGKPLPGVEVYFDGGPGNVTTNEYGCYCFCAVKPGEHTALALTDDFAPKSTGRIEVRSGSTSIAPDLLLHPGARLKGVILESSTGKPLAGLRVEAGPAGRGWNSATTDKKGQFDLGGLPPGELKIRIDSGWPPSHDAGPPQIVSVTHGETISGIVLSATRLQFFSVSGFVRTVTGEPIPDGDVYVVCPEAPCRGNAYEDGYIESDGSFVIDYVTPGRYQIIAEVEGYAFPESEPFTIDPARGDVTGIEVVASSTGGTLDVRLTDADTGEPAAASWVWCVTDSRKYFIGWRFGRVSDAGAETDSSGRIVFRHIPAGTWCIQPADPQYQQDCAALATVTEGATTTLNVTLKKNSSAE